MDKLILICLAFAVFSCAVDGKPQFFPDAFSNVFSGNSPTQYVPSNVASSMSNGFSNPMAGNSSMTNIAGWIPPLPGAGGNSTTSAPGETTAPAETTSAPEQATPAPA